MADISKEIQDFQEAEYGEEVRDSMISLAEKVNEDGEKALEDVAQNLIVVNKAVNRANTAASGADEARQKADAAAENANNVRESTEVLRDDLQSKRDSDYWRGQQGIQGIQGEQGESGVMAPASGMFSLFLDPAAGNLYAEYPEDGIPPVFEYDSTSGNLYYVTD